MPKKKLYFDEKLFATVSIIFLLFNFLCGINNLIDNKIIICNGFARGLLNRR